MWRFIRQIRERLARAPGAEGPAAVAGRGAGAAAPAARASARAASGGKQPSSAAGAGRRLTGAALMAAAAAFVMPWEGLRLTSWEDRLAAPPVWTICYGETRGVGPGERRSPEACRSLLLEALEGYHRGLATCLPDLTQQPEGVQIALVSWSYNVGTGAACRSRLVRLAREGRWPEACGELLRWTRAGGIERRGLVSRRRAESALCRQALSGEGV